MVVRIRRLKNNRWRVYDGKKVTAKSTTKKNALKQAKLLRGVAHGMKVRRQ